MQYEITKIAPKVFQIKTKLGYDIAMLFWRYQEYYESSSALFRNKSFTLVDYMEWYSANLGPGNFSYATDWIGFNIPGFIVEEAYLSGISDCNKYDHEMKKICGQLKAECGGEDFYLIGVSEAHSKAVDHELAHGFYFTNQTYRKESKRLIKTLLTQESLDKFTSELTTMGYAKNVMLDEIQAYLGTGVCKQLRYIRISKKVIRTFEEHFLKYKLETAPSRS